VLNRADLSSVHFCHAAYREATGRLSAEDLSGVRLVNTSLKRVIALALERWCFRLGHTSELAAVSPGVSEELARHFPGLPVVITPNGVDTNRFRPDAIARLEERQRWGALPEEVVALFVGGDWERKGLALALEALAQSVAAGEGTLRLVVAGRGDQARFENLARSLGVGDRVSFVGFRSDAERPYQAADLLVLPSTYETFSLVAFEAAASGLPIVCTFRNGVEELIGDNEGGLLVPRTAPALAGALRLLASDGGLRTRMGSVARERAQKFTWEASADSVARVYEEILSETAEVGT